MRSEMGNNNVVAGPKEEDKPRIEDQEKPQSEENNGIDFQEENQVVSEEENKNLHEQTQGLSFNVPLADNQPLELTEEDKSKIELEIFNSGDVPDISADDNDQENMNQETEDKEFYIASPMSEEHENAISPNEILVENVESSYILDEEKQELPEREQVTEVAQDVELFGDKIDENLKNEKLLVHDRGSEDVKILSQSKENKDTYLVDDKINEINESAIGMAHDNDSKVIETILENEESKDENIASQIKNTSGNGIENIEIKEKETHIVSNIEGEITDQSSDLEEETVKYMEIEKDIELSVIAEEKGKSEAEMPYSEANFRNSLNIQDEKQDFESEQISLKSPELPYSDSNKANSIYSLKIQDEKQDLESEQISLKLPELPYSDSQKADSVYSLNIQDKKQDLGSEVTSLGLPELPFSDFQEADSWKIQDEKQDLKSELISLKSPELPYSDSQKADSVYSLNIQDEKQDLRSEVTSLELPELPNSDSQEADSWKTQDEKQDLKSELISLKSAELPYSDSHEANSGYSLNIQYENQDLQSEQVSLKSPGSDFELGKLETLDPSCSLRLLETKTMTVLETEKNNGRLSTGSIQEKPNIAPELKKSTSFVFDLPLELKFIESDQTPLLFQNKTICRSMSSPSSPPVFLEEKTIQVQRNDSRELSGSFPDLVKDEGNESFSKQDFKTGSKENVLTKRSGKRRPRSSMLTTCICCAAAIS